MERREKSKRWAPSEGADKVLSLRLGTRLIKLTFSAEKLKKISSKVDGVTTMQENLRPLCVVDPLVGSVRCLLLLCSSLLGLKCAGIYSIFLVFRQLHIKVGARPGDFVVFEKETSL